MKEWLAEAEIAKLEDEIGAAKDLASLDEAEGSMLLEAYLKSRKNGSGQNRLKWNGVRNN